MTERRLSLEDGAATSADDVSLDVSSSAPSYAPNERLNASISLWTGDIARLKVDAIVNAANPSLLGTAGGVNGSIHRQAGDRLRVSCARHLEAHGGKIPPGGIVVTPSYELPSNYIIHCVVGDDAAADATLSQTYRSALDAVDVNGNPFATIALCDLGRGVASDVETALRAAREFLIERNPEEATDEGAFSPRIIFTVSDARLQEVYEQLMRVYFP